MTLLYGDNPDAPFESAYILFISHVALGFAFVYSGTWIAPSKKIITSYVLTVLSLISIGFMLFPAVYIEHYGAMWGALFATLGVVAATYSTSVGKLDEC